MAWRRKPWSHFNDFGGGGIITEHAPEHECAWCCLVGPGLKITLAEGPNLAGDKPTSRLVGKQTL
jgi:hypothetical protein